MADHRAEGQARADPRGPERARQGRQGHEHGAHRRGACRRCARRSKPARASWSCRTSAGRRKASRIRPRRSSPSPRSSASCLGRNVPLAANWLDGVDVAPGELVLCENVRFNVGEEADDDELRNAWPRSATCSSWTRSARRIARKRARTASRATRRSRARGRCSSRSSRRWARRSRARSGRLTAIIGGSKVSTKIEVLQSLSTKVDELILGGGIANTILAASGVNVGKSLHEKDMLDFSAKLLRGEFGKAKIPLPTTSSWRRASTPA